MTLDEWNDIVARMTPEEREAMAAFGEARAMGHRFVGTQTEALAHVLGSENSMAGARIELSIVYGAP